VYMNLQNHPPSRSFRLFPFFSQVVQHQSCMHADCLCPIFKHLLHFKSWFGRMCPLWIMIALYFLIRICRGRGVSRGEKDGTHSFFTGNIMSGSQLVQFTA
jgi:hypothetical protein